MRNLNISTKYYVRISTTTAAGRGNYSDAKGFFTNGRAVEKAFTGTSSTLTFSLNIPTGRFSHIYVVVLKVKEGKQPNSPDSYSNDELLSYANARRLSEPRPYIACVISRGSHESDVLVLGNGKHSTHSSGRKRRTSTSDFFNGPLEGDTSYSISLRVFVDDKVLINEGFFPQLLSIHLSIIQLLDEIKRNMMIYQWQADYLQTSKVEGK